LGSSGGREVLHRGRGKVRGRVVFEKGKISIWGEEKRGFVKDSPEDSHLPPEGGREKNRGKDINQESQAGVLK